MTYPWHKCHRNPNRLLHSKNPPIRRRRRLHRPLHPLRLARKPPRKPQRIVQLALTLGQRLTRLIRHDLGQIVAVVADELIPFEEALGAGARVDALEGLKSGVRGGHGGIGVVGGAVWGGRPDFAVARVVDVEAFAGCGVFPFAADEGLGAEDFWVVALEGPGQRGCMR